MAFYAVQQLSAFLHPSVDAKHLKQRLGEFRCVRDSQLEDFIHNKAIFFEIKGYARTYFVFDTSTANPNVVPPIAAFFTLALTATDYSGISKSRKEKVLGSKPGRNTFSAFAGILIGQLARDDHYGSDFIDGAELLEECERHIALGRQYLGGRIVYLDCKKPLVEIYGKCGYATLTNAPSAEGYYKMYKILPDKAFFR